MNLSWDQRLDTGITCFDEEHRTILKMLNILRMLLKSGDRKDAKNFTVMVIIPYLINHLRHEEEIMSIFKFPEYERHMRSHMIIERLFRETLEYVYDDDRHALRHFQAITFGWLFGHIVKADKKYGDFFMDRNLMERVNTVEPVKPNTELLKV